MPLTKRPRVGLALCGGGARGLVHIGVLKVLAQNEIPCDCVAGTSMGGIIAAMVAAGWSPGAMEAEALRMRSMRRLISLIDRQLPRVGLLPGERVTEYLQSLFENLTFGDLAKPLAMVAVDLLTGQSVTLCEGRLVDALRATISVPGVFAPVPRGHALLVDGGVLDNLPVQAVRSLGADIVVAVDLADPGPTAVLPGRPRDATRDWHWGVSTTQRALEIMMRQITNQRLLECPPDVLITVALPPELTGWTGFNHAAELIALGEAIALDSLPAIRRQIADAQTA
jgi:NTE family protein